ncbi:hypothetical protein Y032_0034g2956 [Ancylostoma ceylanicum]|uniref:Uncharacterized protein n=1 Tax=Ancylostoma ceylanicum TaxID=53326 RepID=A0A016UNC3_9BILA|nr:hypothetical protein Y032_0034g2956 [Ancylostoma ceylanicum]
MYRILTNNSYGNESTHSSSYSSIRKLQSARFVYILLIVMVFEFVSIRSRINGIILGEQFTSITSSPKL